MILKLLVPKHELNPGQRYCWLCVEPIPLRMYYHFNPLRSLVQPINPGLNFAVVVSSFRKKGFEGMAPQEVDRQEGCAQEEGHGREEDGNQRGQEAFSGQACHGEACNQKARDPEARGGQTFCGAARSQEARGQEVTRPERDQETRSDQAYRGEALDQDTCIQGVARQEGSEVK